MVMLLPRRMFAHLIKVDNGIKHIQRIQGVCEQAMKSLIASNCTGKAKENIRGSTVVPARREMSKTRPQNYVFGIKNRIRGAAALLVLSVATMSLLCDAGATENDNAKGAGPIPFESLNEQQQQVLAPMRERWGTLSTQRQQRLIKGADRWAGMNASEREKARDRMRRWQNLPPEERQRMQQRLQRFRSLPPERRQRLRQTLQKFKQLPAGEREALREKWRNASPVERRELRRMMRESRNKSQ